jgi:hypothetical protein
MKIAISAIEHVRNFIRLRTQVLVAHAITLLSQASSCIQCSRELLDCVTIAPFPPLAMSKIYVGIKSTSTFSMKVLELLALDVVIEVANNQKSFGKMHIYTCTLISNSKYLKFKK